MSSPPASMSPAQARRLAIVAQGLGRTRRLAKPDRRHLRQVLRHTGLLQIDSVNVLARAHYLPPFSRLGGYPVGALDQMAWDRELFEYWGHEASLLPVETQPLLRWRMAQAERGIGIWRGIARLAQQHADYVEWVYGEVAARGPISAGEVVEDEKQERRSDKWGWNWSDAKTALEYLHWAGRIATASRRNFERLYDLPERVLPPDVLAVPTPDEAAAHRELILIATRCHGIGTASDLGDYFRIGIKPAQRAVATLVEDGRLVPVAVAGWRQPAYLLPDTTIPARVGGRALLAPFDPLVWERDRVERLFGFRYRIEIYVPKHKRQHGYYVLPFLLRDRLVARVDLKADRAARRLLVPAAWQEAGAPGDTAEELAAELRDLAGWLGLDDVVVGERGDLAAALQRSVAR
ncbi:MAG TPA: crosslink repair DNA glycosylase YcaQ family protein [Mycobacteriales bacterium]|nr:crosslink repair DNA glycosylase YcaQ family protein [Mycobacteriales bacterium]